ncbi:family 43 glycosylhydrolase [Goekera deserti]|uniref:glycoside hydrolase family 43 protein n=1 Tax=Goekera deserti TaxID=2497753 RepID=UPI00192E9089|nr:family 43 glycosylhydrolase [Goekera deserti]
MSRRAVLIGAGALLGAAAVASTVALTTGSDGDDGYDPAEPLIRQRADPFVVRAEDGRYLFTASVPEYDRIVLRGADTVEGLRTAEERTLWTRPGTGQMGGYIWAPELHLVDGVWHVYFAAGDADDEFHIRPYVLVADGPDPLTAGWSVLGQIETAWDSFSLDATTFTHRGTRYLVWAQQEDAVGPGTNLYISAMSGPATLTGEQARIAVPSREWETIGFRVNEGPAVIVRGDRVFCSFSASATDANYCMGLLTAPADADLLDPGSWTKSDQPVFRSNPATSQYGPGHNSFTVAEDGSDLFVYHSRDYEQIDGDPLFDPNRNTRVQQLRWTADGTPDFGVPEA